MLQFNITYQYFPDDITCVVLFNYFFIRRGAENVYIHQNLNTNSFTAIIFSRVHHIFKKVKIVSTVNSQLSSIQTSRILIQLAKISKKIYRLYKVPKNKYLINIRLYCTILSHTVY
jgi:hypothetical protein